MYLLEMVAETPLEVILVDRSGRGRRRPVSAGLYLPLFIDDISSKFRLIMDNFIII